MKRAALAAGLGALVWSAAIVPGIAGPAAWPRALVALAALVVVPLGLALAGRAWPAIAAGSVAAVLLAVAARLPAGLTAGALALPWLAVTSVIAGGAVRDLRALRLLGSTWPDRAALAARLFVPIGAAWALADRLGWTPFGFDATTVILTAAHFHYAGFALPLITSLAARARPSGVADAACGGVIGGVPAVALGISATHAGVAPWLEPAAVGTLGAAVLWVASSHGALARDRDQPTLARVLFAAAAVALAGGTALAILYGARTLLPATAFPLDVMWRWHGSLQALGFTVPALLGWWVALLPRRARS